MTQEEKELLLKDLFARLPYNVIVHRTYIWGEELKEDDGELEVFDMDSFLNESVEKLNKQGCTIKPYLRPISSMTDEEKGELKLEQEKDEELFIQVINKSQNGDDSLLGTVIPHYAEDWANKNHFDYRGLIEKGLALEAPDGMYNLNKE